MGKIIDFYRGQTVTDRGYSYEQILNWSYDTLEHTHDYIQWLFPLPEPSVAVPYSPVLQSSEIEAFQQDQTLQSRLRESFQKMLAFYGLTLNIQNQAIALEKSSDYLARKNNLLTHPHNFLRITRILRSLRLLGLETEAQAFFTFLQELYQQDSDQIGQTTFTFWERAVTEKLS